LGHIQRSIWWQGAGYPLPETKFDLAYSVRASTYRGQREVQIEWIDYRLAETESISVERKKRSIEVIDLREESEPLVRLNQLQVPEKIIVWGEAEAKLKTTCLDRFSLYPAEALAIWTIPPGPNEIRSVLELVKPAKVYLFGNNPGMDEPEAFLKRLVGLLKNRIKTTDVIVSINTLAIATAQTRQNVRSGLEWLDAYGHIRLISLENDEAKIETGTRKKKENAKTTSSRLHSMLAESAAFRRYYLSANKDSLFIYWE
jgi:single-stranded-DNA-specific exonuclease